MLLQRIFHKAGGWWLAVVLPLSGLAAQCTSSTLPLPLTSTGPTIRVALLAPHSGELAPVGRVMRNGVIMAFDEWNQRGGVLDHQLEWRLYDTECTFRSSQQASQAALDDGLQFIIGPICSEAAIAAASLVEPARALTIVPAATHPLVTRNYQGQTRAGIFRVSYDYAVQGRAAAYFAYDWLEVSEVALLFRPGDDYASELAAHFAQHFAARGGDIVHQATYSSGPVDFTELLLAINQSEARLIYLPASPVMANQIAGQLHELGLAASAPGEPGIILLGSDRWASEALDLAAVAGSYFPIHFSPDDDRPRVQRWTNTYESTYAVAPGPLAALSYDAANILVEAMAQSGSLEPGQIASTLEQQTFEGVTGQIAFDPQHNPSKGVPFVQVDREGLTYLTSVNQTGN